MGRPDAAAEREYSRVYRAMRREERRQHIVRWWLAGICEEDIVFATGYHPKTVREAVATAR